MEKYKYSVMKGKISIKDETTYVAFIKKIPIYRYFTAIQHCQELCNASLPTLIQISAQTHCIYVVSLLTQRQETELCLKILSLLPLALR